MTNLYLFSSAILSASEAITDLLSLMPESDLVIEAESLAVKQANILLDFFEHKPIFLSELQELTDESVEAIEQVEEINLSK